MALEVNWRGDTWISGFEVKVSRGDFLRDAKYLRYKDYADDLTLVCPARMIDRSEVPEPVGLMYYDPSKRTLRYRRKPNPSHGDTRQVEHRLLKSSPPANGRTGTGITRPPPSMSHSERR